MIKLIHSCGDAQVVETRLELFHNVSSSRKNFNFRDHFRFQLQSVRLLHNFNRHWSRMIFRRYCDSDSFLIARLVETPVFTCYFDCVFSGIKCRVFDFSTVIFNFAQDQRHALAISINNVRAEALTSAEASYKCRKSPREALELMIFRWLVGYSDFDLLRGEVEAGISRAKSVHIRCDHETTGRLLENRARF